MKQQGQIILILILVMTVALAIGLSIVQKSLVDVSTSSKVEQSSRAFSAAEAGVEKALKGDASPQPFADNNSSISAISNINLIPCIPGSVGCAQTIYGTDVQAALEYPPLAKEDVAQVWLADPDSNVSLPTCTAIDSTPGKHTPVCYTGSNLDVYWGNLAATDKAAIELTLVYYDGTAYQAYKWYLDQIVRTPDNRFETIVCSGYLVGLNSYQCKKTLSFTPVQSAGLMLIRARLLYNSTSQAFAVQDHHVLGCTTGCYLPPQAKSITSTGLSGETQRKVNLFQLYKVAPPYFDYAIFSAGEIKK